MNTVDLHVHSNMSDGTLSPEECTAYAIEKGLSAYALTDHDTTAGIAAARKAAKGKSLKVIPGIELSTAYRGVEVHIVGLMIDEQNRDLLQYLNVCQDTRHQRNLEIIRRFNENGIPMDEEAIADAFPDAIITRAHFARYLLDCGYVTSIQQAFVRYLNPGKCCYVPRKYITPATAIGYILKAKGVPVLAHPMLYHMKDAALEEMVRDLKADGLLAIEAIYSTYSQAEESYVRRLASRYHLAVSGGSDFHGSNKPHIDMGTGCGSLCIPEEILNDLRRLKYM
ncbi:PHP domain-containing protein [Lachnotalea sp. AF33-28]|uniref:PHP domain-containing protein n=1 Tax=Lachnotalea sp. AF33-28 TaxID=2292046 RepID=UPI000E4EEC45|nr:PHP domain-containing protein [Lachnotalea sp. AF33-28]RHP29468.1 PHP domain-containing protein [Lachnotalea sp. AF33-28]